MSKPVISVIMPCYNQARFLTEAVASLQAQRFPQWECIIVNDGSSDDTAEVGWGLAASDSRVRLINQRNQGLPRARNRGLQEAGGRFLHFLDADDYILPEMYEVMLETFKSSEEVSVAYSGFRVVGENRGLLRSFPALPELTDVFHELLLRNPWPCHSLLVRKAVIESVGGFAVHDVLHGCEDWDLWLRIASTGRKFVAVTGEFACYRRYSNNMSSNGSRRLKAGLAVIDKNLKLHQSCRACRVSAVQGRLRCGLEFWEWRRSEIATASAVTELCEQLHRLLCIGRTDLRVVWGVLRYLVCQRVTARSMRRNKPPRLRMID